LSVSDKAVQRAIRNFKFMPKEIAIKTKEETYYKCTHCGDEIFWNTHRKLTYCKCKKIWVDGCEDYVLDAIFHEEDNDDMMKMVAMFDGSTSLTTGRGGDASELSNVLELVTDAWNYFPHEILGGISPAEKLLEHHNKSKK